MTPRPPTSTLFPYTTLFRSDNQRAMLRRAFDLGITHFDLANNYGPPPGSAEENFGRFLHDDFAAHRDEIVVRSEEHTSELQSHSDLVCRLLLEKKKKKTNTI